MEDKEFLIKNQEKKSKGRGFPDSLEEWKLWYN